MCVRKVSGAFVAMEQCKLLTVTVVLKSTLLDEGKEEVEQN